MYGTFVNPLWSLSLKNTCKNMEITDLLYTKAGKTGKMIVFIIYYLGYKTV